MISMKPSRISVLSFKSSGYVAVPDCLRIFDFEGAAPSCSTVHFGLPRPVLVAVQPLGAAPTASDSKLTSPSAMTRASMEQRSAAVIRTVFIVTAHSVDVASLKISSAREETRKQLIIPRLNSEQRPSASYFFWHDFIQISYSVLHVFPG